jgi:hypothetical protein
VCGANLEFQGIRLEENAVEVMLSEWPLLEVLFRSAPTPL